MLYGSDACLVKEEDVIRLERNGKKMVKLMCNVKPEDKIS